jgi:DNA-binding response OmpR family regulator
MKVLVAEDDATARLFLVSALQGLGHVVTAVPDGREAWGAFQKAPFPVVVSDWVMPDIDGLELCRRIRETDRTRYTYLILLTSLDDRDHYREGMQAGADDFLTKPPDLETLQIRLRVAERIVGLQEEVRRLEGLLSICAYCKRIRDERQGWVRVEEYIEGRSDATFTHGICPECRDTIVRPEIDRIKRRNQPPR